MMTEATELAPAVATYRGDVTCPERWSTWTPRRGDVLVCTPPKCGTTWTQTMVAMLLAGRADLGERIGVVSPWVDSVLGEAETVRANLAAQEGRRVVKTHTPADGFPAWEGVTVIAVYRHPLDVFVSLRSHVANRATAGAFHRMRRPLDEALAGYLEDPADLCAYDEDTLATVARHYRETALSGRLPDLRVMHYADMVADHRGAVQALAGAIGVEASPALIDAIVQATAFDTMRAEAHRYVPEPGTGFWHDDAGFFAKGGAGRWREVVPETALPRYAERLAELIPDPQARRWLEEGGAAKG
ncbi:sulfotransferase domain-containing protein [Albimonas sp. CAU 1670]|uniref:sulfotransferase domain-containing protein n=1 Tax=Albimonas sp. CAU 1670 TaxID=3032599 RepID=UPI0023DB8422|nr:sulfotransferase domain-containing protein [Albimonas sp. CAU 1670]MDF2231400.1 sulfotransferase domain-containing protein [Albimonas sp. CAU 1670]